MKIKLIRDNLNPEGAVVFQCKNTAVHKAMLIGKLHEEAQEIAEEQTDPLEYADALTILKDLAKLNDVPWELIEKLELEKAAERGRFLTGKVMHRPERLSDAV